MGPGGLWSRLFYVLENTVLWLRLGRGGRGEPEKAFCVSEAVPRPARPCSGCGLVCYFLSIQNLHLLSFLKIVNSTVVMVIAK